LLALAIRGLTLHFRTLKERWGRQAVALLAVGASGDAADAIYHQLAYEMIRPGVDQAAMLLVMQRMQSADLLYLLPLLLVLLGCVALAVGSARSGIVTKWNPMLYVLCPLVVAVGRVTGTPGRVVGLTCLGLLNMSLGWIGIAIAKSQTVLDLSKHKEDESHA
jgi:hypothetical protein